MALHAVDDLTDAFEATRSFLWPVSFGRWARLALLSLFVAGTSGGGGSGFSGNSAQYTPNGGTASGGWDFGPAELGQFLDANLLIIVPIVLLLVALGLAFAWLASVFEFTYLESLRRDAVRVREYSAEHLGNGTHLFGFRLVFGLLGMVIVGAVALLAVGPALLGFDPSYLIILALFVPVFIIGSIIGSIVYVFTTAFVAPIMLVEDRGVISGWRRLWGVMQGNWTQFGVFALVGLFVMIGVGIAVGIAVAVLTILIAIPFALIGIAVVSMGIPAFNWLLLVLLGVPFLILMLAAVAVVQVPVQTYLRYWALLVLGDVEPDLDLIPEQRAAIRENRST